MVYRRVAGEHKPAIISMILVVILSGIVFSNDLYAKPAEEFEPDVELLQKLAVMSHANAAAELDKLSVKDKYEYSLILASVHASKFKNVNVAMQFCSDALKLSENNSLSTGKVFLVKGYIYNSLNKRAETIHALEKAAECLKEEQDTDTLKQCLSWLGSECYNYGNFDKSQQAYEELIKICTDTDDETMKAQTLFGVGEVYYRLSKMLQARNAAEQAKTIFEKKDDQNGLADCLKLLGNVYSAENNKEKSRECYLLAIEAYKKTDDSHGQANCNYNLGLRSMELKQYAQAEEYLTKANYLYSNSGSLTGYGISQMELGRTYRLQGLYDKAELALKQAESCLTGRSQYRLAQAKEYLGDLELVRNNLEQSAVYYKASIDLFNEVKMNKDTERVTQKMQGTMKKK